MALGTIMYARGAPTFYRDVLPVLQHTCQNCHRKGEAAPMPLIDFREVRLVIEEIDLGGAAVHEEVDEALCFGGEMRQASQGRVGLAEG